MRGLLTILIGLGFCAVGLGYIPVEEPMPIALSIGLVIGGALFALLGAAHIRLRIRRKAAYHSGRERRGNVRLATPLCEDDSTAYLVFGKGRQEWLLTIALTTALHKQLEAADTLEAKAWLGEDDKLYALDVGDTKVLPLSAGVPMTPKLRAKIQKYADKMSHIRELEPQKV